VTRPEPRGWLAAHARLVARRPGAVVAGAVLLTAAAGALAATSLGMETARSELVGGDADWARRFAALEAEFGDLDSLVVAAGGDDRAAVRRYAEDLAARVAAEPEAFAGAFYRVDPAAFGGHALLYLDPADLERLAGAAGRAGPHLAADGALAGGLRAFAAELRALLAAGDAADPAAGEAWGATARRLLVDTGRALAGEAPAEAPWGRPPWEAEGYSWAADGRTLIVLVHAREAEGELDPKTAAVERLRELMAGLARDHPEVEAGLTGKPVLQVDEMETYVRDSAAATAAALSGVTLLLVIAFRRLLAPLLIGLCLAMAVVLTLGGAALWPGHLNLLAAVFVVVVIGLGVDFAIHVVARYDAEAGPPAEALARALDRTGAAVGWGAATTAVAFVACLLTGFKGLREFGAIAAMGVAAALVVMFTVLPALVTLLDRRGRRDAAPPASRTLRLLDGWHVRRPGRVLAAALAFAAGAAALLPGLVYEPSLLALQDPDLPSVQLELRLLEDQRTTSWFLAYPASDRADLERAAAAARALEGVERVESVLTHLPAGQAAKLPRVRAVQAALAPLAGPLPPVAPGALGAGLDDLIAALEEGMDAAFRGGRDDAVRELEALLELAEAARDRLEPGAPLPPSARAYDALLAREVARFVDPLTVAPAGRLGPEDLPPALRDRLVGGTGKLLLRIYPRGNMWERAELAAFVDEVSAALPGVTGVPEVVLASSRAMEDGYRQASVLALAAVAVCLLVAFRSLWRALLALATLGVGALWLLGLVVVAGAELNPANVVALPLLLGIGVDSAVHVIARARESGPDEGLLASSLGRALVYSTLTSVAGFGSLLVARHPGMRSMGLVISLGVLACLAAALLVPPAVLRLVELARRPRA